jgi:hypothetical protein
VRRSLLERDESTETIRLHEGLGPRLVAPVSRSGVLESFNSPDIWLAEAPAVLRCKTRNAVQRVET